MESLASSLGLFRLAAVCTSALLVSIGLRSYFLGGITFIALGPLVAALARAPWRRPSAKSSVPAQIYRKQYLLPFGEYVPGASWFPWMDGWKTTGQFLPGKSHAPLDLRGRGAERTRIAPSICFEAIQPGWFNAMVRDGAELLVNITDDGWFGDTAAPYQHLQLARMRAVETRRWLVRASNSGISAFIDPMGEIVASLPLNEVGTVQHAVAPIQSVPLYVRLGDWPVGLSALIISLTALRIAGRRRID